MPSRNPAPIRSLLFTLLCLVAVVLSAISLYQHTLATYGLQEGPSFCNLSKTLNCDAVNASPYALLFGFPVAAYGLFFYLGLLLLSLVKNQDPPFRRAEVNATVTTLTAIGVAVSVYFFAISKFEIRVLCPTCLALYVISLALFLINGSEAERPFFQRLVSGARLLTRSPLLLVSTAPNVAVTARLMALALVLLGAGSFSAPKLILFERLDPVAELKDLEVQIAKAVDEWREATPVDVTIRDENQPLGDYSQGTPGAPVSIVEFSDFECPFCRNIATAFDALLKSFPGKIHFVFKNFPLDKSCNSMVPAEFHQNACEAALFARCAGEQGKFWEASHLLFSLPIFDEEERTKDAVSTAIQSGATSLGLDAAALSACQSSGRQLAPIHNDIAAGAAVKLQGTPFIVINGRPVSRPLPEVLTAIVEEILQNSR